jgi:hypothetical protein
MLAPANLPRLYRRLNERHGAPFGRALPRKRLWTYLQRGKREEQLRKPFCMQPNYTNTGIQWPFEFARLGLNMRVAHVVNIDPGMEANGVCWSCTMLGA